MLFYVLASLAICASLLMILTKNPVIAVLSLITTCVCMSGIWLLLGAEFLSMLLIIVYVGAIMVLFLFVVMMIDLQTSFIDTKRDRKKASVLIAMGLGSLLLYVFYKNLRWFAPMNSVPVNTDLRALATLLYTEYLFPFEMAGVILLVALIAAITLMLRGKRSRSQEVSQQHRASKANRLTVIKNMDASC